MTKPKSSNAWCLSVAAVLQFIAMVFSARGGANISNLAVFGLSALMFVILAVLYWKKYFEALIDFKVKHEIEADTTSDKAIEGTSQ